MIHHFLLWFVEMKYKIEFIKLKKKKVRKIRLLVPSGLAMVTGSIGPLLGQFGINAIDFCNQFNERS
jgi:hypothetical protein